MARVEASSSLAPQGVYGLRGRSRRAVQRRAVVVGLLSVLACRATRPTRLPGVQVVERVSREAAEGRGGEGKASGTGSGRGSQRHCHFLAEIGKSGPGGSWP